MQQLSSPPSPPRRIACRLPKPNNDGPAARVAPSPLSQKAGARAGHQRFTYPLRSGSEPAGAPVRYPMQQTSSSPSPPRRIACRLPKPNNDGPAARFAPSPLSQKAGARAGHQRFTYPLRSGSEPAGAPVRYPMQQTSSSPSPPRRIACRLPKPNNDGPAARFAPSPLSQKAGARAGHQRFTYPLRSGSQPAGLAPAAPAVPKPSRLRPVFWSYLLLSLALAEKLPPHLPPGCSRRPGGKRPASRPLGGPPKNAAPKQENG